MAALTGRSVLAVLPLGATEQHGPHLPEATDTLLAEAAARALEAPEAADGARAGAGAGTDGVRVLPALAFGSSGEHQAFPGTVSMGTGALTTALLELGRSVSTWADRMVVVNGHGGNVEALRRAVPRLRYEGRDVAWLSCRTSEDPADTHAGHAETSLMLHLHPGLVRMEEAVRGCTTPLAQILGELREGGVGAVSASGVLGDPTTATAAEGRRLWGLLVEDLRRRVHAWSPDEGSGMLG